MGRKGTPRVYRFHSLTDTFLNVYYVADMIPEKNRKSLYNSRKYKENIEYVRK